MTRRPPIFTLFPAATLPRSSGSRAAEPRRQPPQQPASCSRQRGSERHRTPRPPASMAFRTSLSGATRWLLRRLTRSEEHTAELQSHLNLSCRLLLEKKNISH